MKKFIITILFASICFGIRPDYFQQHVAYDIEVTLDDSAHTLQAFEKIVYTNNSPDTLDFIWFHIWPNAYKDNSTALAKHELESGNTNLYYATEEDRGFISNLKPRDRKCLTRFSYDSSTVLFDFTSLMN